MVKDNENEVTPSFVGTFVIVTFDSESWIDADEDDSTLAGKGKCNSKEQSLKGFLQKTSKKNKILTFSKYFSPNVVIVNASCAGLVNYIGWSKR